MKTLYTTFAALLLLAFTLNLSSTYATVFPSGWEFQTNTSNPHGMIVLMEANPRINDIPLEVGDFIGAFYTDDNGDLKCGGADFWLGDENIIFCIFADDPDTPEKDGFSYGEQMYFKVYSMNNQKAYDVDMISWDDEYYSTDHWSPLGLSAMSNLECNVDFDAYASANPSPVCLGEQISLSANIFVGTTGTYTYNWSSNPLGFSSTEPEAILTPTETTTYFLEVSDGILTSSHSIVVEVHENPSVEAGDDMTICPTGCASLSSEAQNYSTMIWESEGDGSFDNPNILNPLYYPGQADLANGLAIITATANPLSACDVYATDDVNITIQSVPVIGAPTQLNACGAQNIMLNADAINYSSLFWTTQGDGTFSDASSEITQYFPGPTDVQLGEFTLNICATAILPMQGQVCVEIDVDIFDAPVVNAPTSQTKCDNLPIPVMCIPNNYNGVLWTTAGDGTFDNPEIPSTLYHAGEQDKINGGTVVTVNVFGEGPCEVNPITKNIAVNLLPSPSVNAGNASVLCSTETLQLDGSVDDYTYFMWSTSGDGYFSNMILENPVYYPGASDVNNGEFTLTLTAYPVYPCTALVTDELFIEIVGEPVAEIITDDNEVFPMDEVIAFEAQADDYQSLLWETSGDGTFDNPTAISANYTPGPNADASGNPVTISLTAFAASNCGNDASDEITISFNQMAAVSAGDDITACQGNISVSASSQYCNAVAWQTNGDGVFADPTSESTFYTPGENDVINGVAEICITGFYGSNQSVSDCINITVLPNPSIDAGFESMTVCHNQSVEISLVDASNYSSLFWYTTNGGGFFSNNGTESTVYNPSPIVDYPQGCISVFVLAQPVAPCTLVDEIDFQVCFQPNPEIEAGLETLEVCYNQPVELSLNEASNFSSIFWYTTNGGGEFANNGSQSTVYNPSPSVDYPQGCINIFALAQPIAPCSIVGEVSFEVCFLENPQVDAGEDFTITEEETFIPSPAFNGQGSILWETTGDGTFNDATLLAPEYFPGENDIYQGSVQLSISILPIGGCTGSAYDELNVTIHRVQSIVIPEGWSGLSSYIENDIDIEDFFEQISDQLITAQTITDIYWPEGMINTIGNFSNTDGYKIRMSESVIFKISGEVTSNKTINLSTGWNLVPVLSPCILSYYDMMDILGDDLIVIKEIAGNGIIWPDMGIYTLNAIMPGKAYLVAMSQEASFTFEDCDDFKNGFAGIEPQEIESPWISPEQTTITHTVAFKANALAHLENGDFIGAFNSDGFCVGVSEIIDVNHNVAISIYGDEAITSETEGMLAGEEIEFRVFHSGTQTEEEMDVIFNTNYSQCNGTFAENGLSVVESLVMNSAALAEVNNTQLSVYPNPSKGMVNISTDDAFGNYEITISDMSGHSIMEDNFTGSIQLNLTSYPKGFYLVVIKGEAFQTIEKLVID